MELNTQNDTLRISSDTNSGNPFVIKIGHFSFDVESAAVYCKTCVLQAVYQLSFLAEACFLDMIILLVLWRLSAYIFSVKYVKTPLKYIQDKIHEFYKWFIPRRRAQIDFLNENQTVQYGCSYYTYTRTFRAVVHKATQIKDERIWHLRFDPTECYDYSFGYGSPKYNMEHIIQDDPIEVEPDIFLQFSENSDERPSPDDRGRISIRQSRVSVFSEKLLISDLKKAIERWTDEYQKFKGEQLQDKQLIFLVRFKEKDAEVVSTEFETNRSFDNFFFDKKEECLDEIQFFLENKEWYAERGLQDSLGVLAHGIPGCGKTSFIKALLKETKRHAVIFSINANTNLEKIESLMRSETLCDYPIPQSQRIYVLEDIDAMGDIVTKRQSDNDDEGKENEEENEEGDDSQTQDESPKITKKKQKNTYDDFGFFMKALAYEREKKSQHHLSFLLNILDGIVESQGRIVMMTTNHIEKLDPALIRPGRVDLRIEFKRCSKKILSEIVAQFYETTPKEVEEMLPQSWADGVFTPAEVIRYCRAHRVRVQDLVESLKKNYKKYEMKSLRNNNNNNNSHNNNNKELNIEDSEEKEVSLSQLFFEQKRQKSVTFE